MKTDVSHYTWHYTCKINRRMLTVTHRLKNGMWKRTGKLPVLFHVPFSARIYISVNISLCVCEIATYSD